MEYDLSSRRVGARRHTVRGGAKNAAVKPFGLKRTKYSARQQMAKRQKVDQGGR